MGKISELLKGTRFYFGCDGGAKGLTTFVRFVVDKGTMTLYIDREAYEISVELNKVEQLFDSIPKRLKWIIKSDFPRSDTISYLQRKVFSIAGAKKGKVSIEDRIAKLKNYNSVIDENHKHTINEFILYNYKKNKVTVQY